MNFAKVYKKHIKKKGISGALPHNLTVHIEQYIQNIMNPKNRTKSEVKPILITYIV